MQKFKFGDRVIDKAFGLGECVVINTFEDCVHIRNEQGGYNLAAKADTLELVKSPDTVRLDFIERVINVEGMVKREMRKGWVLVDEDGIELAPHKPLLRDAIDAVMRASEYLSK